MVGDKEGNRPALAELIRENDARLYHFCFYMLSDDSDLEPIVLEVFRKFGNEYRKMLGKKGAEWGPRAFRLRLFQIAWDSIQRHLAKWQYEMSDLGRDMRTLKTVEGDLLSAFSELNEESLATDQLTSEILMRLGKVDREFRAPLVLRDMLGFSDEEVTRILATRWGVYRHRLHRGRLEFRENLRGISLSFNPKPAVKKRSHSTLATLW